ncbi:glycosyltransferase [Nocardioides cynanchi]|uniref:glycosyltransferase n=1 Tax=Nocardioides cynanchi TaxID=2558918 RepID=UPI00124754FC|nr:glycosyltransferase [Nocardioides cynanchi]
MDARQPDPTGPMRLSVVMATFEGETYLPEMLDSLATQTRLPDELVVRDDGSSDATVAIVEDFAGRAPFPVRVLTGERLGYAQNFVSASRACTGDLIFFADQDDSWRPAKLETVAAAAQVDRSEALFHDFALMSGDGAELAPSYYSLLAGKGFGPAVALKGCTMAVTRRFVETWGWPAPDTSVSHDFWVALLATAFGQRRNLDAVLIDHRLHDSNTSGWIPDASSRVFTEAGVPAGDVDVLIDLVVKRPRLRGWTRAFLDAAESPGGQVDPAAARQLQRSLRTNRRRHRAARG